MDSYFLNKKGSSLIQILIALVVIGMLITMAITGGKGRLWTAQVNRAIKSVTNIAKAAQQYEKNNGSWPTSVADMQPDLLDPNITVNGFGNTYDLVSTSKLITVSTLVPDGPININAHSMAVVSDEGSNKRISVTLTIDYGTTAQLRYDKKYLYGE